MSIVSVSFNGIEIDMLSLGDADCIVVTQWFNSYPWRVLIDGGSSCNAATVKEFLRSRGQTDFWAVLCTHAHNDHACGLVKLIQDRAFTFSHGWMHDICKHIGEDALRRAAAASDGVKEVIETTKELASAFASRGIAPQEPFAGSIISFLPSEHERSWSVAFVLQRHLGRVHEGQRTNSRLGLKLVLGEYGANADPIIQPPFIHSAIT